MPVLPAFTTSATLASDEEVVDLLIEDQEWVDAEFDRIMRRADFPGRRIVPVVTATTFAGRRAPGVTTGESEGWARGPARLELPHPFVRVRSPPSH